MTLTKHRVQGRPWDAFDGYLFDIDGTLLTCSDAVHYFAFCDALLTLSGRPLTLEGVTAHGNTDVGILRDALALAGVLEADWRPKLPAIRESMAAFVHARRCEFRITVLPHVHEVLRHLSARGATLGIATGNLRSIGRMKLERAGLLPYFSVFGWSDDYEYRADVFKGALEQMRAATPGGSTLSDATICILGDTPTDILAATTNGVPAIAVATGVYTQQQLQAAWPALCLSTLEELFREL